MTRAAPAAGSSAVARLLVALGLAILTPLAGAMATATILTTLPTSTAHAGAPADETVVAIDDRVSVAVPPDMTREQRSLGARGDMLTLVDGGDVMVIVVYRRGVNDKAPTAAEALAAHADELERALGPATRRPLRRRALGRDQTAVGLTVQRAGVTHEAWVVAFEAHGRTVVATAVTVKGSPNDAAMQAALKAIRVQ